MSAAQVYQQEVSENGEALRCIKSLNRRRVEGREAHSSFGIRHLD